MHHPWGPLAQKEKFPFLTWQNKQRDKKEKWRMGVEIWNVILWGDRTKKYMMVVRQHLLFFFFNAGNIVFCITVFGEKERLQDANKIQPKNVSIPARAFYVPLYLKLQTGTYCPVSRIYSQVWIWTYMEKWAAKFTVLTTLILISI